MQREISQAVAGAAPMRCLWISRYMPYPLDAGAKVYSARLAESLAGSGAFVRYLGFGDVRAAASHRNMEWVAVPGEKRRQLAALFSRLPVAAAIDATPEYSRLLDRQLLEPWDAIVFDGYGTGWALQRCRQYASRNSSRAPALVHVSHNHEEVAWRSMARSGSGSLPKRLALWMNYRKVRALERKVVRGVDLITAITDEDAAAMRPAGGRTLTLTPGHAGWIAPPRVIDANTPRRVIVVGSFRWVMKQENLTRFVEIADPVFRANGIALDVVGDVPDQLLATLRARCQATHFHGFVDDIASHLSRVRIAVVPELIGARGENGFLFADFGYWKGGWQSASRPGPFVVVFVPVWLIGCLMFGICLAFTFRWVRFRLLTLLAAMTLIAGLLWLLTLRAGS